jgi:hypothetical protein
MLYVCVCGCVYVLLIALMMVTVNTYETSINFYETTQYPRRLSSSYAPS